MLRLVVQPQHLIMCRLASSAQIIQDPTADFKVTTSGQFVSRISAGRLAVAQTSKRSASGQWSLLNVSTQRYNHAHE